MDDEDQSPLYMLNSQLSGLNIAVKLRERMDYISEMGKAAGPTGPNTTLSQDAEPVMNLNCRICGNALTQEDKQKTKDKYWKNCKRCRHRATAMKRKSKMSSSSVAPEASASNLKKQRLSADGRQPTGQSSYFPETLSPSGINFPPPGSTACSQEQKRNTTTDASKDEEQKPSERECSVCADSFLSRDFPSLMACEHVPDVCHKCFLTWLNQEMASNTWEGVKCPTSGCNSPVTHEDVQKYAPIDTFIRFDELLTRSYLSNDPNFRQCLRSGCSSGQIHDSGIESNVFRCIACGFLLCTVHEEAFHTGETCEDYDKRKQRQHKADDDASAETIGTSTKRCPGTNCGVSIEKNNGCDHMTCRQCRHQFCWQCLAPYRNEGRGILDVGNHAHERECMHWREERAATPELEAEEPDDNNLEGPIVFSDDEAVADDPGRVQPDEGLDQAARAVDVSVDVAYPEVDLLAASGDESAAFPYHDAYSYRVGTGFSYMSANRTF